MHVLDFLTKNKDSLTIVVTVVIALVGGCWAIFKYRKPSPTAPKTDSTDRSGGIHIEGGIQAGSGSVNIAGGDIHHRQ